MESLIYSSNQTKTTSSDSIPTPDNSQQKIYWSFNKVDDLGDNKVENDAPNATGEGCLSIDDSSTSIIDKALQLGAEK